MKTTKEEINKVRSLICNTSVVEGCVGAPKYGLRQVTSESIIHTNLHKPNKLVNAKLEHFLYMDEQWHTWTYKTHHGLNLGEATTFPF
jgi:hypothetical protein